MPGDGLLGIREPGELVRGSSVRHLSWPHLWRQRLRAHCHDVGAERAARAERLIADILDDTILRS
jgi:hypothetical protein